MKSPLFFMIICFISINTHGQNGLERHYTPHGNFWGTIEFDQDITDDLKIEFDFQYRRQNAWKGSWNIFEVLHRHGYRLWIDYRITDKFRTSISPLAYMHEIPLTFQPDEFQDWEEEYRSAIRADYLPISDRREFMHRYTLEYRRFNNIDAERWQEWRVRYLIRYQTPLSRHRENPQLILQNEILINFGKQIRYNIFDHYRTMLGFDLGGPGRTSFTIAYMFHIIQQGSGDAFDLLHILSCTISINNLIYDQF